MACKYKDSKIDYIGLIPIDWKISKYKYFTNNRMGETILASDTVDDGIPVYSATQENSIFGYVENSKIKLKKDDFVIPARGNSVGYVTIIPDEIATCTQTTICSTNIHNINTKYLYYCSRAYKENWFKYDGSAIPQVTVDQVNNNYLTVPSLAEQIAIVNFLDINISKIDSIIQNTNRQIDILNKLKKCKISEVVTSGLNKNVEFKDSGIEWIGKIPKHWEIKRLKYLGTARNGLTYSPDDIVNEGEGILVLRSSNIQNGRLSFDDNVFVNCVVPDSIKLKENDLLICSRNGSRNLIGKNALIDKDNINNTYGAFMCVYRSKYNKFIHYVFNSNIFEYYLNTFLTSTINQLTNSNLYSIKIPFTYDIEEQKMIVDYLDDFCSKIDSLIEDKYKQVRRLINYKQSVIYEYVTGKKRVGEFKNAE